MAPLILKMTQKNDLIIELNEVSTARDNLQVFVVQIMAQMLKLCIFSF
jgi:hypothetical protein